MGFWAAVSKKPAWQDALEKAASFASSFRTVLAQESPAELCPENTTFDISSQHGLISICWERRKNTAWKHWDGLHWYNKMDPPESTTCSMLTNTYWTSTMYQALCQMMTWRRAWQTTRVIHNRSSLGRMSNDDRIQSPVCSVQSRQTHCVICTQKWRHSRCEGRESDRSCPGLAASDPVRHKHGPKYLDSH